MSRQVVEQLTSLLHALLGTSDKVAVNPRGSVVYTLILGCLRTLHSQGAWKRRRRRGCRVWSRCDMARTSRLRLWMAFLRAISASSIIRFPYVCRLFMLDTTGDSWWRPRLPRCSRPPAVSAHCLQQGSRQAVCGCRRGIAREAQVSPALYFALNSRMLHLPMCWSRGAVEAVSSHSHCRLLP